jgi:hypothetical protein
MSKQKIELIRPQVQFLNLAHKFRAYVAGYRGGKTWAGCTAQIRHVHEFPRVPLAYYAPTYPLIRDIYYPTVEKVARSWGMRITIREANKEVHLYHGKWYYGTIICRSMEKPGNLIGYEVGSALCDEIDTLPAAKAGQAWDKIIARNSVVFDGLNRIDVCTTPEGFAFTYNRFVKAIRDDQQKPEPLGLHEMYGLIQASTYENEKNLPNDYIPSLLATYDANIIEAYLHGRFINLQHGTVYKDFDRELNASSERIKPKEPLHIGMDFNVGKMAAIVSVKRKNEPHAADEIINAYDTPDMIRRIQERYWPFKDGRYHKQHEILIYPDSSGAARKTVGASSTDITLLKDAGFIVRAHPANPPIKDRVNSLNAMICNAEGKRRLKVNPETCPRLVECLEQQPYNDRGEPDKTQDLDHPNDALGYFMTYEYPIRKPVTRIDIGVAM